MGNRGGGTARENGMSKVLDDCYLQSWIMGRQSKFNFFND